MAIVAMKKLTLVGLSNEKKLILEALHYVNCVQLKAAREVAGTERRYDEAAYNEITEKRGRIQNVIDLVESRQAERKQIAKKEKDKAYEKPKKPFFTVRRDVSFDEFTAVSRREWELFALVDELERKAERFTQLKAERARLKNQIDQLSAYASVPLAFSEFVPSKSAEAVLGQVPEAAFSTLSARLSEDVPDCVTEEFGRTTNTVVAGFVYLKADAEAVRALLADANFSVCPFAEADTAANRIQALRARIAEAEAEETALTKEVAAEGNNLDELKLLSDYYLLEQHKAEAERDFARTSSTFVLEAWLPYNAEDAVKRAILAKTDAVQMFVTDPEEGEESPTLTKNVKLVSAYESVTNMFSVPRATERDPNLFVAMFFFLFFGIMVSDAGYGIVLALVTMLAMRLFKMETPMKKMMLVLCMGGISTLIWGAVFGSWFGVNVTEADAGPFWSAFRYLAWFNPLDDPMKMLILCLALGLFQILFGMGIHAVDLIKRRQYLDAVAEVFSWYIFFIGVFFLLAGMVFSGLPAWMNTAGLIVMASGLGIVVLTAGHKKKGIFGKLLGGLGGLYNIVNFLSDILSYSRLFGLGIATGVIGFTMNLMADLLFGILPPIGYLFGVIVLIGGHVFNIAINTLGAYIHNSRLQYVEFFGRFFEGGGEEFQPLGFDTEYVKIR